MTKKPVSQDDNLGSRCPTSPDVVYPEDEFARWLGDAPGAPTTPDPVTGALDQLLKSGPAPQAVRDAQDALHHWWVTGNVNPNLIEAAEESFRLLARAGTRVVWYDQLQLELIGTVYLAVSEHGLLALEFCSDEADFQRRMRHKIVGKLQHAPKRVAPVAVQLREYLRGERTVFDLPLDMSLLTDFQRQVLQATLEVPCGQVATYGEIARRIGKPKAARAVGQALGRNPIPIVIPCHRVLASDGSLGGYSGAGGIRTKRRLLQLEGAL